MLNNLVEKKKPFLTKKKQTFSKSQKSHFFKGVAFSVKITLEISFNNVLDRKETFFSLKKIQSFKDPKN